MSFEAVNWAIEQELKSTPKLVLICIAYHTNGKKPAFPSISRLSKLTGANRRTVMRSLEKLESDQFILVEKHDGQSNKYWLNFDKTSDKNDTGSTNNREPTSDNLDTGLEPESVLTSDKKDTSTSDKNSTGSNSGLVTKTTLGGDKNDTGGVTFLHQTSDKNDTLTSKEPVREPVSNHDAVASLDLAKVVFDTGKQILMNAGKTENQARGVLGKLRKQHSDAELLQILNDCQTEKPLEPVSWLMAASKAAKPVMTANDFEMVLGAYRDTLVPLGRPDYNPALHEGSQCQRDLTSRWRQIIKAGWNPCLEFWLDLFETVTESELWMNGSPDIEFNGADFPWLMQSKNFDKAFQRLAQRAEVANA